MNGEDKSNARQEFWIPDEETTRVSRMLKELGEELRRQGLQKHLEPEFQRQREKAKLELELIEQYGEDIRLL